MHFMYTFGIAKIVFFSLFLSHFSYSLNYSDKSVLFKPHVTYRIHADFWKSLYTVGCGSFQFLPIIDLFGKWITFFVAAVNFGIPYFYLEFYALRFTIFNNTQFKSVCSLVGSNCKSAKIITFCFNISKFIKDYKEVSIFFSF